MELKSHHAGTPEKVRINQVPRQIPEKRWYLQPWVHILLGGVLPFGSIFIEMYFIFTSFYKYYYVYGFMLLVYVILIIVTGTSSSPPPQCTLCWSCGTGPHHSFTTVCVTIVSTYFLLNSEDYRWQWTSFLSAASTAGYDCNSRRSRTVTDPTDFLPHRYVFLYSVYYFYMKTKMSGFFQTVFYFGYMAMFCLGLATLCGTRLLPSFPLVLLRSLAARHGCLTTFPTHVPFSSPFRLPPLSFVPTRRDRLHRHVDVREEDLHHDQGRLGAPLNLFKENTHTALLVPDPRAASEQCSLLPEPEGVVGESEGREKKRRL